MSSIMRLCSRSTATGARIMDKAAPSPVLMSTIRLSAASTARATAALHATITDPTIAGVTLRCHAKQACLGNALCRHCVEVMHLSCACPVRTSVLHSNERT